MNAYLELSAHRNQLLFQVVGAKVEGVEHLGELDVFEDLGVDPLRVLLLELEPHHLDRQVSREAGNLQGLDILSLAVEGRGGLGERLLQPLKYQV